MVWGAMSVVGVGNLVFVKTTMEKTSLFEYFKRKFGSQCNEIINAREFSTCSR